MSGLIHTIYSLLMWAAQPLLRRKLRRRGKVEAGYLEAVDERFGVYSHPPEIRSELVWVHAVSLGETRTAGILMTALRARFPGLRVLLTHGTATGRAEGAGLLREGDVQVWQPWDSQAAVERFFKHFQPRLGLLMETEVWPNAVACAHARGMPLALVNARLSEKSMGQALRIALLSRPAFKALTAVYAQSEADAQRLRALGATVQHVLGNLKFDAAPDAAQQVQGRQWRVALARPILMLASSREGEEEGFLEQASVLVSDFQLLIVPRHPQRFDEVAALAGKRGLSVLRRSSWSATPVAADIWLGDSLGEMALYYAMSDVALLGGSFAPLGGQNLIEAAACGCPVIMGPHTFNFAEVAELAESAGAARRVQDMTEAMRSAKAMLVRPAAHQAAVAASLNFSALHRGATANTVEALASLLKL